MKEIHFPQGFRLERLRRDHPRNSFRSSQPLVDDWLATKALLHQTKHLSATKVLIDSSGAIVGYYTLAPSQLDFGDLPPEITRRLPHRLLPVAVLAWLGVAADQHGQGLGERLLAHALRDCWEAGRTFPFVAVILDCIDDHAKLFYQKYHFAELPGQPNRLFLSIQRLDAMM